MICITHEILMVTGTMRVGKREKGENYLSG